MPLKEHQTTSYINLMNLIEKIDGEGEEIFLFFSCTLDKHGDPKTKSCFEAEDVLMEYTEYIKSSKRQLHLVYCRMQLEEYFKSNCELSKDLKLRVSTVPTLIKWKSYQRLSGTQCSKFALLSMVFEVECPNKFPVYRPCTFFKLEEPKTVVGAEGDAQIETGGSKRSINEQQKEEKEDIAGITGSGKVPAPVQESVVDEQNLKTPSGPESSAQNGAAKNDDIPSAPKL